MKKKCKYCGKEVNVSLLKFNSDAYCERHSPDRLLKWRKGNFPNWEAPEYPQAHVIDESSIQIIWKGKLAPDYKYCKAIDETLKRFEQEQESLFLLEMPNSNLKKCVEIIRYDYENGSLYYYDFNDYSTEKEIHIFDIHTLRRVYKTEWIDVRAYKVFYHCENGVLHSKGGKKGMTFRVGQLYDAHTDCAGKSDWFFNLPYYNGDGCEDDDIPFRFYKELSHVFELADLIQNPLQKELRLYHIQALNAGRLTHGSNNWAAQKIKVLAEVTPAEIIDYFSDPLLKQNLFSKLEKLETGKKPNEIWDDYCNFARGEL